jgi:hypothetical protein
VSEKTIEDTLTDSGLVSNADDEKKLAGVDVTGKALTDIDLPITDDKVRNTVTDSNIPITGDIGNNRITDSSLPVNQNVGTVIPTLEQKEIFGKREIDTDLPITGDTGNNRITDSSLPVDPNAGGNKLNPVTIVKKREAQQEFEPVTIVKKREVQQELEPVTIVEKREVQQEFEPKTIIGKREVQQEFEPKTIIGKKEEPALTTQPIITLPNITLPKTDTKVDTKVDTKTDDTKVDTKKTTIPEQQLYQTTTQSNPTTPQEIKYFLDMIGSDILPPINKNDPVESLVNPPMSLEELLHHLRS